MLDSFFVHILIALEADLKFHSFSFTSLDLFGN